MTPKWGGWMLMRSLVWLIKRLHGDQVHHAASLPCSVGCLYTSTATLTDTIRNDMPPTATDFCALSLCRTVEEVNFDATLLGLLIAAGSVVASGSQQILVRSMQQVRTQGQGCEWCGQVPGQGF